MSLHIGLDLQYVTLLGLWGMPLANRTHGLSHLIGMSRFGLVLNQRLVSKTVTSYLKMFSSWLLRLKIHHGI
jgi:hypothetical protein